MGDIKLTDALMNTLSAKGRGYIEAALKLAEGQRLVDEATLEMQHLDGHKVSRNGYGGTAGGRLKPLVISEDSKALRATASGRRVRRSDDEMKEAICIAVGHAPNGLTTKQVIDAVGGQTTRVDVLLKSLKREGRVCKNKVQLTSTNNRSYEGACWFLKGKGGKGGRKSPKARKSSKSRKNSTKTDRQRAAKAADPALIAADQEKILAALEATPGLSIGQLMTKLKRSFYPTERAVKDLVKAKKLKPATFMVPKTGRVLDTWVPQ